MYLVRSNSYYVPRIVTVLLHCLGIFPFFKCVRFYATEYASKLAVILYAVSPMLFTNAILQLKDTLIVFILLLCFSLICNIQDGRRKFFSTLFIAFLLSTLISIRAMVIVTFIISVIIFSFVLYSVEKMSFFRGGVFVLLVSIAVFSIWRVLSDTHLLLSPDDYFRVRFELLGDTQKMSGSKSHISSTGFAALVSAPLYLILSPLLPVPDSILFENPLYPSTNMHFAANLFYYAILPYVFCGAYYIFRKRKVFQFPFFILVFFLVYKIGSALSGMAVFSYRQSLPTILCALMMLPVGVDYVKTNISQRIVKVVFLSSIVIMCMWSIFRLYIRQ